MADELLLVDEAALADLGRYAVRARALDESGAVRLTASGLVLAAWVAVLPGTGLLGEGVVLGLRTAALAEPAELDVTVPLGAVTDRVRRPGGGARFPVPPTTVHAPWTSLTPPRSGWRREGTVAVSVLAAAAREGIADVARGTPPGAGAAAVGALRARVWGRAVPLDEPVTGGTPAPAPRGVPAGGAFAAYGLGFLPPSGAATVHVTGPWVRLSTPAGHVLMRRPAATQTPASAASPPNTTV
ncbi:MAG TPA: hypothetical protein VES95_11400 [Dermatophilaceae bacterium]|nr:hypothetical protein [Dermatophilaceae bacterium]